MSRNYISSKKVKSTQVPSGEKFKSTIYVTKECFQKMDSLAALTGKESRSQIIEDAVSFYHAYIAGEINQDYLCGIYGQKVEALMSRSTDRLSRLLFKIAVNDNMLSKLIAGQQNMTKDAYDKMRQRAVQDTKAVNGIVDLLDAGISPDE